METGKSSEREMSEGRRGAGIIKGNKNEVVEEGEESWYEADIYLKQIVHQKSERKTKENTLRKRKIIIIHLRKRPKKSEKRK